MKEQLREPQKGNRESVARSDGNEPGAGVGGKGAHRREEVCCNSVLIVSNLLEYVLLSNVSKPNFAIEVIIKHSLVTASEI